MNLIKLNAKVVIYSADANSFDGRSMRVEFEPVFVNHLVIESIVFSGLSDVKMQSGDVITVRETPEEIIELIYESQPMVAVAIDEVR